MRNFYPTPLVRLVSGQGAEGGLVPGWIGTLAAALPQRAAEWRHARARQALLRMDEHLGDVLAFSGRPE